MRFIIITIVIGLLFFSSLSAKKNVLISYYLTNDTCKTNKLSFKIGENESYYDSVLIFPCKNHYVIMLDEITDFSIYSIEDYEIAYLTKGTIESFNFEFLIFDPIRYRYTHKLYFNTQLSNAVLEDYKAEENDLFSQEEVDNYFYTQQLGDLLIITKKAEIDVLSVVLCTLDGRIISSLQNVEGWSQYSFDMFGQPSGLYLIRFISPGKALTKRILYLR